MNRFSGNRRRVSLALAVAALGSGMTVGLGSPAHASPSAGGDPTPSDFGLTPVHFLGFKQPHGRVISRSAHGKKGVYVLTFKVEDSKNKPVVAGEKDGYPTASLVNSKTGYVLGSSKAPNSHGWVTLRFNPSARHKLGKVSVQVRFSRESGYLLDVPSRVWSFKVVK